MLIGLYLFGSGSGNAKHSLKELRLCVPTSFSPIPGKIRDDVPWKRENRHRNQKPLNTDNTLRPRVLHQQSGGNINTYQLAVLRGSKETPEVKAF